MKRLYLLRHAEAAFDGSANDKLRTLTEKGMADAAALGTEMDDKGYVPDYILCSPATRTQQTLRALCSSGISCPRAEEPQNLYNASTSTLLDAIHGVDDAHGALLVVAHNPGIHYLAAKLANDDSHSVLLHSVMGAYPPATLSVYDCDIESWSALALERNLLVDVIER